MRALALLSAFGLVAMALATPVAGQRPDDQISVKSVELQKQGETQYSAGKLDDAEGLLETALAVDPRNRSAYVDLARVADRQKLYGKAIRLTNKALALEPNDREALAVQGQAMVELGAVARAQVNLQKLQGICGNSCPQVTTLAAAINHGPTVASAKPVATSKSN